MDASIKRTVHAAQNVKPITNNQHTKLWLNSRCMIQFLIWGSVVALFCCPAALQAQDRSSSIAKATDPLTAPDLKPPKFELGPTVFFIYREEIMATQEHDFGFGARFTYNPFRHLSLDAEFDRTPYESEMTTFLVGGNLDAAFWGVKSGMRWRKWGLFGKFRPGFLSYTNAIKSITGTPASGGAFTNVVIRTGRFTEPAFDTGGGFELYVSRHMLVRYDFGEMIVHHGAFTVSLLGGPGTVPASTSSDFSFSTGLAFRF